MAPALHRNLSQHLWSQPSTWGAPAALQGALGWAVGSWKSGQGGENPEERGHHTQQRRVSSALAVQRNSGSEKPLGSETGKRVGTRTLIHPVTEQDKYPARVCVPARVALDLLPSPFPL